MVKRITKIKQWFCNLNYLNIFFFLACTLIFFFSSIFMLNWGHEFVHEAIYTNYNIESETFITWYGGGYVQPLDSNIERQNCDSNCKFAHSINEAVGYNVGSAMLIFLAMFFCWLFKINIKSFTKHKDASNETN